MKNKHNIADLLTEFRPEHFAEIVGQGVIKKQLTNMVANDAVPNGIMFSGTWGVGKTTLAKVLANALSCEAWKPGTYEPCGGCESCMQRTRSIYLMHSSIVTDERLKNEIGTAKYAKNMWGGRKAVLIIDDIDNVAPKNQRLIRASLDEHWTKGALIVTAMDAGKLDKPLRQRLIEMPVMPPLLPETVAWLRDVVLKRLGIGVTDEKVLEELVKIGQFNFRSILKILSPIYNAKEPLTVAAVRDAALQNGYG